MKKIYTLIAAALLATGAAAQNPTAYFMEGSTFRSQFNPAFAPLRGYVNIPAIGGVNINVGGNIAVDNILFSRDGKLVTLLDSSVSAADALSGLKQNNLLGMDFRMNVIGFGAFTKNHKNFWSFDLNVRVNEDANLPYSLFEFIKLGKEGQIRNFGTSTDSYLEAAFSYSFPLMDDRLYIGSAVSSSPDSPVRRSPTTVSTSRSAKTAGPFSPRARWTSRPPGPKSKRTPTARPSRSAISTSNPPNPQDTASPSIWAPRTTSCPTCKRRWP